MYTNATNSCKRIVKENGYKIDVVTKLMKRRVFILCSSNIWQRAAICGRVVMENGYFFL